MGHLLSGSNGMLLGDMTSRVTVGLIEGIASNILANTFFLVVGTFGIVPVGAGLLKTTAGTVRIMAVCGLILCSLFRSWMSIVSLLNDLHMTFLSSLRTNCSQHRQL